MSLRDLPPECLALICSHLNPKKLETVKVLPLVCTKLRDFTRTCPELWRSVRLSLARSQQSWQDRLQCFARWVVRRAAWIQRLSLQLALPGGGEVRAAAWALVLEVLAAVAPTLQEFELAWPGPLEVGAWLAALPQLHSAFLEAAEMQLSPAAALTPTLRSLSLSVRRLVLPPPAEAASSGNIQQQQQCLPATLQLLDLFGARLTRLPAEQLARLPALRLLDISCNPGLAMAEFDAFSSLAGLEELALNMAELPQLPHQLSLLSELRVLYLHSVFPEGAPPGRRAMHAQFAAALGTLRRLVVLSISNNGLRELPHAVTALAGLKALYVEGNRLRLTTGPFLASLEELCLDWDTLFAGHGLLAASATCLTRLYLSGSHSLGREGAANAPLDVARSLAACPKLRQLVDVLPEGSVEGLDIEVARLMYALPSACPHLCVSASASDTFGVNLSTMPAAWGFGHGNGGLPRHRW